METKWIAAILATIVLSVPFAMATKDGHGFFPDTKENFKEEMKQWREDKKETMHNLMEEKRSILDHFKEMRHNTMHGGLIDLGNNLTLEQAQQIIERRFGFNETTATTSNATGVTIYTISGERAFQRGAYNVTLDIEARIETESGIVRNIRRTTEATA